MDGKTPGLKADLHLHTCDCRKESTITYNAFQLIDFAAEKGFEVLSITNHDTITFSTSLQDYARERGIILLPGIEITIRKKHVLAYNLSGGLDQINSLNDLRKIKDKNNLFIAPHPFFPSPASLGTGFLEHIDIFDAVEMSHFYTNFMNFNKEAVKTAAQFHLPLVGSSDCHVMRQLGTTYSMIYAERNTESIIQAIKKGDLEVVTRPLPFSEAAMIMQGMLFMKSLQKIVSICPPLLSIINRLLTTCRQKTGI